MKLETGPNLAGMDLNLLVAFEAFWLERSVTAAGKRLGLSQPAASGALSRLRVMLGDRLFIRTQQGIEPTGRCIELAAPLCRALVDLRNVIAQGSFNPARAVRQLRVGAVDAAIAVVMPSVLRRTMREAPGSVIQVVSINPTKATRALEDGTLDLAISPRPESSAAVRSRPLYPVAFVVAVRAGHPLAKGRRTRESLDKFPRVHAAFEGMPLVRAQVLLSSFLAVPPVLAESDAWALLPAPYAEPLARAGHLVTFAMPAGVSYPSLKMQLLWPDAQHEAPASMWLRDLISEAVKELRI